MSNGKKNIWTKIVAAILAILMLGSVCFTVIFYFINVVMAK